jgi:hypothetical protein
VCVCQRLGQQCASRMTSRALQCPDMHLLFPVPAPACPPPFPTRFPPATKAAILVTLGQLIRRAGAGLKPFVPQLQTTFVKCLNDQVRRGECRGQQGLLTHAGMGAYAN